MVLTFLDLAGAVALLLWGVHMVQSGVHRAFGARLRSFLATALSNRFKAFAAGIGVTAALQSSTATGLMVTGFAADGLVALPLALAVMLGANVGTTLIVQVLSFDVSLVAPIFILAGVALFSRAANAIKDFGRVLIGLGLMLLALHQMLALLGPLMNQPGVREALDFLPGQIPFAIVLAAIFAWAAHSSVAVILISMSLAAQGAITPEVGVAFVLGANLGAAINPVLEGVAVRDPSGRRLPVGNLLNRVLGVVVVVALFPWITALVTALDPDPARAVANFHTAFNATLALAFFPFLTPLAAFLTRLMPARPDENDPARPLYLDPLVRETPALALGAAAREALRLSDTLEAMLANLKALIEKSDRRQIGETKSLDDVLDRLNTAIKAYVISIDPKKIGDADARRIAQILAFSINLEQAGDIVDRNLLGIVSRRLKRGLSFSAEGQGDLVRLVDRLIVNVRTAAAVFVSGDERAARLLAAEKEAFRAVESNAYDSHLSRLRSGEIVTVETSSLHLDALRDLKQINAHLVEAAAYPLLRERGELLPSRIRFADN